MKPKTPKIAHGELLRILDYSHETGVFIWKILASSRAKPGQKAGAKVCGGYLSIKYKGESFLAHRLAWFYVNGEWPDGPLDHRDGIRTNNAIANLREADTSLNAANKRRQINNTSGAKGVQKRANNRWRASIEHGRKWISLGTYGSREEASAAYLEGARMLFGDFARAE